MKVWSTFVVFLSLAIAAGAAPRAAGRSALLVDDDNGQQCQRPFSEELTSNGWAVTTFDVSAQGEPSSEAMSAPDLVIWVTGGGFSDLSSRETALIDQRVRRGGNTVIAGRYTGRSLNWGFLDHWLFGFEYRATTVLPEPIARSDGFPANIRIVTDHSILAGGEALWAPG